MISLTAKVTLQGHVFGSQRFKMARHIEAVIKDTWQRVVSDIKRETHSAVVAPEDMHVSIRHSSLEFPDNRHLEQEDVDPCALIEVILLSQGDIMDGNARFLVPKLHNALRECTYPIEQIVVGTVGMRLTTRLQVEPPPKGTACPDGPGPHSL